jgi:hypothetical protein
MELENFNPLEFYKYTTYEDEIFGKRFSEVHFIDTTNTIKEYCNNKVDEATYLKNRIGSNNKILDIRNFKLYVESKKIYDENYDLITDTNFVNGKKYYIQDVIEVIFVPQYPEKKFFTEESYKYFKNIYKDTDLESYINLYSSEVYINGNETYFNLTEKEYCNLKDGEIKNI